MKYIKYILEIEATVYKTFPAEIIDGPASAFFLPLADRSIFYIKKEFKNKNKKKLATLFCPALPLNSHESTSCLHLVFYKI